MGELIPFPRKYDPQLTYRELANHLQVSVRQIHKYREQGMPSCGIGYGGKRRFRLSEVEQWLRGQEPA